VEVLLACPDLAAADSESAVLCRQQRAFESLGMFWQTHRRDFDSHEYEALNAGILEGVTRRVAFELAEKNGVIVEERDLTRYDIITADECFLTGTAAEIIPAVELDRRLIGNGQPGAVTLKFIEDFRRLTQTTGTPIY